MTSTYMLKSMTIEDARIALFSWLWESHKSKYEREIFRGQVLSMYAVHTVGGGRDRLEFITGGGMDALICHHLEIKDAPDESDFYEPEYVPF